MSTEHSHTPRPRDPAGGAHPRKPRAAVDPSSAARIDPFEFEELIRMACAAPAREVDPEVVALLQTTARRTPEFSLRLALTALRLEQGLREAQERVIRLQWELAQCRRHRADAAAPAAEAED
jgi:hypothetical protein